MSISSSPELLKLVSTALDSSKPAGDGDKAEEARTVGALKQLKKVKVTAQQLKETEAGKKISKLKKHQCSAIAEAALSVIDAWKACVKQDSTSDTKASAPPQTKDDNGHKKGSTDAKPKSESNSKPVLKSQPKSTGDPVRDKIRSMLAEFLAMALCDVEDGNPAVVAEEVEEGIFRSAGGVTSSYKSKYRTISFNLKDPNNPDFRRKVLSQVIPAEVLTEMTSEQMASDARREENDKIRDHMKRECERSNSSVATTDAFQCGKCKQRKCTYFPMTTFVTCTVCANKWKFC